MHPGDRLSHHSPLPTRSGPGRGART